MINRKERTKKFCLSEEAVEFIRKYILGTMNISTLIDEEILDKIIEVATLWELNLIDTSTRDYCDKLYDYPEKERDKMADRFVGEVTGKWNDDISVPDFEDLNSRLGLNHY